MTIGSQKSRPSLAQGSHPLVSSRSEPVLRSAPASESKRLERPPAETPSPEATVRRVEQLFPVPASTASSRGSSPDSKGEHKHHSVQETRPGPAPGPSTLVRSVGAFMLAPHTPFEEETDALTALTESIQCSVQQQPDTAAASSGEGTPMSRAVTPDAFDSADPSRRPMASR